MSGSPADRILALTRAMLADQRYGELTHPVTLGLLIARDIVVKSDGETGT